MFHIYSFNFSIIIFVFKSRISRTEVFLRKVFLKISENSQGNTFTVVSFLSAASNFINDDDYGTVFSNTVDYFRKKLHRRCSTGLPPDLYLPI